MLMVFSGPGVLEKPGPSALHSKLEWCKEAQARQMILSPHHTAGMAQTSQHRLMLPFLPALKLNSNVSQEDLWCKDFAVLRGGLYRRYLSPVALF